MTQPDTMNPFRKGQNMARRRGQRKGYLFEKSGSWYIQYRVDTAELDPKGKPRRERLTQFVGSSEGRGKISRREAERIAWEHFLSKVDQSAIRPGSAMTVTRFVEMRFEPDWIQNSKPTTQSQYRSILKLHILPLIGDLQIREVGLAHIQNLIRTAQAKKLGYHSIKHIRKIASAVFHHAKNLNIFVGELPTANVRMPVKRVKEQKVPSWAEVCAIAQRVREAIANRASDFKWDKRQSVFEREATEVSALVLILGATGMRIGEAMGLRWRRVNLTSQPTAGEIIPAQCVSIRENWVMGRYDTPKNQSAIRFIPLTSWAVELLKSMKSRAEHVGPNDPVWAGSTGRPLDHHNIAKRILKQAGKLAGCPWVSWHLLRNANATASDQAGLTVAERQKILGHSSAQMTHHYTAAELERVRKGLEKLTIH